ncbi:hypothetical protein SUDANB2_05862 [Streptomyces sp. enrichment culture]
MRLLVLRGDVAAQLGDEDGAVDFLTRAAAVRLDDAEREAARDALTRLADLRADPRP